MRTVAPTRLLLLLGYVSCLGFAGHAAAQMGPVQPVLVSGVGKEESSHNRPELGEDYVVPVDVYVGTSGAVVNTVVSETSGNNTADVIAAEFMRGRKFLPALDAQGRPVEAMVKVNVNMFKRGTARKVKISVKPPPIEAETQRVSNLMCADFLWELTRMREEGDIKDTSMEVMPYVAAHLYKRAKDMPVEMEEKFWDV